MNRVVATDAVGNPTVDIGSVVATTRAGFPFTGITGYDQRLTQVGFKLSF